MTLRLPDRPRPLRGTYLARTLRNLIVWSTAPQSYLRGRWLFVRIVAACFIAGFWALTNQVLGLVGSDGLAPVGLRWLSLEAAVGDRGIDLLLRCEAIAGVVLGVLVFVNVVPKAALVLLTLLWSLCLYQLGPFDAYQPDAILVSAGLCAAIVAPPSGRPGLGVAHPPSRIELLTVWTLLFGIYWGSAILKMQNPAWRAFTVMDHYWESAPVPAWTGWFVQTYLPRTAVRALCALVLASETLGPLLLLGGRRSRLCFVWLNLALQLGIALTASYSFLNLLVIGLGMLALEDSVGSVEIDAANTWRIVDRTFRRSLLRSIVPAAYVVGSVAMMLPRLIPLSFEPFHVRGPSPGPGHLINTYGLYEQVGNTGYRVQIEGSDDGTTWYPYRYRCLPMDERARPQLVWPYQCRLDWFMWRVSRLGVIEGGGFISAVMRGIASGSTQVASLFDGAARRAPPRRLRVALLQYGFATPSERAAGKWWTTRTLEEHEGELTPPQVLGAPATTTGLSTLESN